MKFKTVAFMTFASFVALAANSDDANAKTLKGTITYQQVPGKVCDKTTKPIRIKIKGDIAEVHIGKKPDGSIKIDPVTGAFKEKHTNDGDVMSGTVHSGKVLKKRCTGTFTTR